MNGMTPYMPHRRARFPSVWPVVLPVAPAVGALTWLMHVGTFLGALAAGLVGGLIGWVAMRVRIAVWRRRHPVISPGEFLDDMRRAARWN